MGLEESNLWYVIQLGQQRVPCIRTCIWEGLPVEHSLQSWLDVVGGLRWAKTGTFASDADELHKIDDVRGTLPWWTECIRTHNLNWMRVCTGSQWSWIKLAVTWTNTGLDMEVPCAVHKCGDCSTTYWFDAISLEWYHLLGRRCYSIGGLFRSLYKNCLCIVIKLSMIGL